MIINFLIHGGLKTTYFMDSDYAGYCFKKERVILSLAVPTLRK
jgi:hypothetical protein